ncbi:MAG: hypothetical protein PHV34_17270 [Verrucomicrobiae bacterium]|nr:hypothetical protein [Verrucomicrobiae bacterium]
MNPFWLLSLLTAIVLGAQGCARCNKQDAQPKNETPSLTQILATPELKLTAEQVKSLRILDAKHQAKMRVYIQRQGEIRSKIVSSLGENQSDLEISPVLSKEAGDVCGESEQASLHHLAAICKILTPAQKEIFLGKLASRLSTPATGKNSHQQPW